jgi:hypothetical protein
MRNPAINGGEEVRLNIMRLIVSYGVIMFQTSPEIFIAAIYF